MKRRDQLPKDKTKLRCLAEERLSEQKGAKGLPASEVDQKMLLHELQVHQIELEMQNEELRRVQEELEAEKERYSDLYAFAPIGYITLSEQGVVMEANFTAATLLEIPWNELIRQPLTKFILPEDQDIYYRHRKKLSDTGEKQICELRMQRPDREPFWVRMEATVSCNSSSKRSECRVVMSDITIHKFFEEEKARLLSENLQLQKSESLRCMAAAITHSFNNILGAVIGYLDLAMEDISQDHDCYVSLTEAKRAAKRATKLTGVMLTYLGHTLQSHIVLDLSETCRRNLPLLQAAMPEQMIIEADLLDHGPFISADETRIQEILINLITNACESSRGQGVITLRVKEVAPSAISTKRLFPIGWTPQGMNYAFIEVKDDGCGISNGDIGKIFDPFYSSKFIGRGLGLSVVQGIVQAHGGAITVDSTPDHGSCFHIYFPLCNK